MRTQQIVHDAEQPILPLSGKMPIDKTPADEALADETLALGDMRFRTLLGVAAWQRLPAPVRTRFGKRVQAGQSVTYAGTIVESRKSRLGRLVAQLARIIGGPLPLGEDIGVPAVVSVTEDSDGGGQFWSRMYGRRHGFPQVIHSSKRFHGATGLEEYLGFGFGIALSVRADADGLRFLSDHYFIKFGALRLRLPRFLSPGALTISHIDRADGAFEFRLELTHALFGEIIHQSGYFRERCPNETKFIRHD